MIKKAITLCLVAGFMSSISFSKEYPNPKKKTKSNTSRAAGCSPAEAQKDLSINNVRFRVLTGGDLWWNAASSPHYEVPKGSGKHSIFAGALWIGGIDASGQLKIAAQSYRQTGDDFWPGPLNLNTGDITADRCTYYDRIWKISKNEVVNFVTTGTSTQNIETWPGNGDPAFNEDQFLAPFFDKDADGVYDPASGDYPNYPIGVDLTGTNCEGYIVGDEVLWWVFNDKGNIHTSTSGVQLGIEVRAQAYGFHKNNMVDNMTFYNYQMINRSNVQINEMQFGQWVDSDLGNAVDDYVGCDVMRGIGYCYNGDADDDGFGGYGLNPPAVGIDFLRGPLADANDGVDNDRDGIIDELGERIQMSTFLYYNSVNSAPTGNPDGALQHYRYLKSEWLDGQHITFGSDGRDATAPPTNFMFSNGTDPDFPGQVWNELTAGNVPADRRFLVSAGPFTFAPGAVKNIDVGVIWARATSGGPLASLDKMRAADDYAQALFDNCFQEFKGPKAPEVAIRELNKEIIISLENTYTSDIELFNKVDPYISSLAQPDIEKRKYKFQGYQVFQLRDANITINDFGDPDKIRLVGQCDVKDDVSQIINYEYDTNLGFYVATEMVNGFNDGIKHTFQIKNNAFTSDNVRLSNHNTYYFTVVAYAHNNYQDFDPTQSFDGNFTQQKAYLRSTENVKVYSAIPHNSNSEIGGTTVASVYGLQPSITRMEGQGNGGYDLQMSLESRNEILNSPFHKVLHPEYLVGAGPVGVKIYDPLNLKTGTYETKFSGVDSTDDWTIKNLETSITENANHQLIEPYQQVLPNWGLTTEIHKVTGAATIGFFGAEGGYIDTRVFHQDLSNRWLAFLTDKDEEGHQDWILAGNEPKDLTPDEEWENSSGWAPYKLCSKDTFGPKWRSVAEAQLKFEYLNSVDVIITSDKSKWTRVPVIEMGFVESLNVGSAGKGDFRVFQSVDKDGNFAAIGSGVSTNPDDANFISETGMGWFPGYAINVETGERLNMAFGENSSLTGQSSRDMLWNPTSDFFNANGDEVFGGGHYIFVFDRNGYRFDKDVPLYDYGSWIMEKLGSSLVSPKRDVWKDCIWAAIPILEPGQQLLSSNIEINLRVVKDYESYPSQNEIYLSNQNIAIGTQYYVYGDAISHNGIIYNPGDIFSAAIDSFTGIGILVTPLPINDFNPFYTFNNEIFIAETGNIEVAKSELQSIRAVPNPYYSYTGYEHVSFNDRVKFTNLPSRCTISIYNLSGSLVKKIKRNLGSNDQTAGGLVNNNIDTSESWDLKNDSEKLVASGVYIIHVDAFELGERTFKWAAFTRSTKLLNGF